MMLNFRRKGASGFSPSSTAKEVAQGINGSGLTAIVTGATSGIGIETARVLALQHVHVVMAVRNVDSCKTVKKAILKEFPRAKVDIMELDLASLASVRKFASDYNTLGLPLNLLINNAGIMATPFMLSQDGIELQFATNHLGHFLLTNLLMENMKKTARESGKEGRIVNVSSEAHRHVYREDIRFDKIDDKSSYSSFSAYGHSKLANILHANELTRHFQEEGVNITANSLHPGAVATNITRHYIPAPISGVVGWIAKHFMKDIHQGAATTCYVALHPDVKGVSGKYFWDSNIGEPTQLSGDAELGKKLWELSFKLTQTGRLVGGNRRGQ